MQEASIFTESGSLMFFGGARRNRTDDLFNAIEALSQLSYGPDLSRPRCAKPVGAGFVGDGAAV
jgi:hypothetical protein